jgi:voltage-gated potassium channel
MVLDGSPGPPGQPADVPGAPRNGQPAMKAHDRPRFGRRVRHGIEAAEEKYSGSAAEDLWHRLDALDFMNQTMILTGTLLLCALPFLLATAGLAGVSAESSLSRRLGLNQQATADFSHLFTSSGATSAPVTGISATGGAVAWLVAGLVVFVGLVAFQVRAIRASPFPGLRAIEALATSVPLFLALFAATYFVMARLSPGSFTAPLTRTDALYFTVTVFSTVGFGDITAKTETARLVVTGQMIADLVILGLAIKAIVGAVRRGRQRQPQDAGHAQLTE